MSTSGSYDSATTAKEIVKNAYGLLNVVDIDEPLPADKWQYGRNQLNKLIKFLSIHKGLWLVEDVTVTLTPGTTSYTIGVGETIDSPKPMQVSYARRSYSSIETPIEVIPRAEYMGIPNKTLQAPANTVYYHPGRDTGTLYVWPTGTSTDNTIIITTQRRVQDFDDLANNPDIPGEWLLLLEYQLAVKLAPRYKGGMIPQGISDEADKMLISLLRFDEEKTSVRFQP